MIEGKSVSILGRLCSTLHPALIYNGEEMVAGSMLGSGLILHYSLHTSAQHLFTPLECEFYE